MKKSFYNLLTLIGVVAGLGSSNAADLDDKETATTMKRMLRADPTNIDSSSNVRGYPQPAPAPSHRTYVPWTPFPSVHRPSPPPPPTRSPSTPAPQKPPSPTLLPGPPGTTFPTPAPQTTPVPPTPAPQRPPSPNPSQLPTVSSEPSVSAQPSSSPTTPSPTPAPQPPPPPPPTPSPTVSSEPSISAQPSVSAQPSSQRKTGQSCSSDEVCRSDCCRYFYAGTFPNQPNKPAGFYCVKVGQGEPQCPTPAPTKSPSTPRPTASSSPTIGSKLKAGKECSSDDQCRSDCCRYFKKGDFPTKPDLGAGFYCVKVGQGQPQCPTPAPTKSPSTPRPTPRPSTPSPTPPPPTPAPQRPSTPSPTIQKLKTGKPCSSDDQCRSDCCRYFDAGDFPTKPDLGAGFYCVKVGEGEPQCPTP